MIFVTAIGNIIDNIRQDFSYCRQGNRLARILAQYASHIASFITWIEKIPYMIESIVTQDILFLSKKEKKKLHLINQGNSLKVTVFLSKKKRKANNKLIVSENKFIVNQGSKS